MRIWAYCTLAGLLLTGPPAAAQPPPGRPAEATFTVFLRSMPVGSERVALDHGADGWTIRSRGALSHPINLQNGLFEIAYDDLWRPRSLTIEGTRDETPFSLHTTFDATGSQSTVEQAGQQVSVSEATPPDAVVLPEYFFGGYEALAARLAGAAIGDEFPVFVAPRIASVARLDAMSAQRIETPTSSIGARVHHISFEQAGSPLQAEIWTDQDHRLLRVSIPRAGLEVAREDVVSVGTRLRQVSHAGDEDTRLRSEGFSLAATITTPVDHPRPEEGWPAVLLVSSSGSTDRDGTVSGVPVLGQIASALADAGYLTVRYDRRGSGQSGGRGESATIEAHGADTRALVRHLDRRDDVDKDRITVLGYGDGGWIAMVTARRESRVDNLVLVGTPGGTGTELVLERQRAALDQLGAPGTERDEKIRLQHQIHDALLEGGTWVGIPEATRLQADTPWFRSFLEFDAADTLRRTQQPLLILRGALDQQVGPHHAAQLEASARTRRREATVETVVLDSLDHRLVDTVPDNLSTYAELSQRTVSRSFTSALTNWLKLARQ